MQQKLPDNRFINFLYSGAKREVGKVRRLALDVAIVQLWKRRGGQAFCEPEPALSVDALERVRARVFEGLPDLYLDFA